MGARLIVILWCLGSVVAVAEQYRYHLMATTGLQEQVFDQEGKATTIVFSEESDEEARFVLSKILSLSGINGTKGMKELKGVKYEQAILLAGVLNSKVWRTSSTPDTAAAEDYQKFTLETLMIRFPFVRHRTGKVFDTGFLETHFSFDTLFPDGLRFEDKEVDFKKYTFKR